MEEKFKIDLRIYWEDTDAGGIVYHSKYLNFAERARTEWVRVHGIKSQREFSKKTGIFLVVKTIDIDYLRPAFLDDELEVSCEVIKCRYASIIFCQHISRQQTPIAKLTVKVASINSLGSPCGLPDILKHTF